jgi:RNA polymerase sigma-70 factor (ECF subfamily)
MSIPDCPWLEAPALAADTGSHPSDDTAAHSTLERWFKAHFDSLWRLAARLGVPAEHVDDVVQDVFVTANRRAAEITPGSERRFLLSATLKISANYRRRRRTQHDALGRIERAPRDTQPDAEQLLAQKQLRELLEVALGALSEEQRNVFVLHELEGFQVPEIAALLEVPIGTVASRLARAREKFSKQAARLRSRWSGNEER